MDKIERPDFPRVPVTVAQPDLPSDGCCVRLSAEDGALVEAAADNPPAPNEAALLAAKRFRQKYG